MKVAAEMIAAKVVAIKMILFRGLKAWDVKEDGWTTDRLTKIRKGLHFNIEES